MKTVFVSSDHRVPVNFSGISVYSVAQALDIAEPGDTVLLDGACTFAGNITLKDKKGLRIGSCGIGRACIDAGTEMGITLSGCEDVDLFGLVLRGSGPRENPFGGITLENCRNIRIMNTQVTGFDAYGIQYRDTEDLIIDGCYLYRNGAVGICAGEGKSRNVRITHCRTHDQGGSHRATANHSGSGIIIAHTRDALVEYCEAAGNGWAQRQVNGNGPVGIWCWGNAEDVVFRHCIAHHNRTQPGCGDGDGFDIDGGANHVLMERCYSYENEASGFLLCEYGSKMGWCDNNVRDCISVMDVTRVGGYGTVHLYCPPGEPMDGSVIEGNFFVTPRGIHAVENRFVCDDYTGIEIRNNRIVTDDPIFAAPRQPQIVYEDNTEFRYADVGGYPDRALPMTEPRELTEWAPFATLREEDNEAARWARCLADVTRSNADTTAPCGKHWFSLLMDGPDFEGSMRSGDCALVYDSLKPGTATALRGLGAEISSYIPLALSHGPVILRARGRAMDEEGAACLFIRESSGEERRVYWSGSVSSYNEVTLAYTPKADGAVFGVRLEEGRGTFLIDRIDVYTTGEALPEAPLSFAGCSCCGSAWTDAEGTVRLENAGSKAYITAQLLQDGEITFSARGAGIAYCRSGENVRTLSVDADAWQSYTLSLPAGERVEMGFAIDGAADGGLEIRDIAIRA